MNKVKVRPGGIYLVNLGKTTSPELTSPHYCVILKTHDKDLFLALPTTSKEKNDEFKFIIPEDGSTCLFKHMKTISRHRILKPLLDFETGEEIILSNEHLIELTNEYKIYINRLCERAIQGNLDYINNLHIVS